ncbi:hypothetical protein MJO28_014968 [Puccinia striiformis f. sp. tritici]|uniref:Uncharacterized protein n=1 Tax=Puccinia striiformis f. sp. tritici TaxID=168172 RepID=A0ACC0DSZ2_9BASI|nr:hypothetical protein MJO28_014968 [Puccinia striiformis f. sp. tritici]
MTLRLLSIPATLLHIQHPAYYLLLASLFPGTTFSHTDRGRFAISTDCFRQSRLVHTHLFSDGILDLNLLEPLKLTPEIIDAMEPPIVPDVQSEPDRIPTTKRYWKESNGQLCSICLESDHQARNCSHQLCLTCGAIDEHITRQCPVSLVCHSCGSRGHLSRHCPSSSRVAGSRCARCDSTIHLTLNCPSIWRAYDEESNDRPKRVLRACYYCGDTGDHFGDECPFRRSSLHTEPSAFSDRSIPKRDSHSTRHQQPHRSRRDSSPRHRDSDRHRDGRRHDNYRSHDPPPSYKKYNNRSGRTDKAAYARRAETDEEEDWFSRRNQRENHKKSGSSSRSSGGPSRSSGVPSNSSGASCRPSRSKSKSSRIGGSYKGGYIK